MYFLYSALDYEMPYLCALQWIYTINCGQAASPDVHNPSMLLWPILLCPAIQVESGWGICCSHQTGGWTPAYTVATLPGHNYLQLTPIEFQDRGSNPVLLSQWIQKSNALTIRTWGNLLCWLGSLWVRKSYELGTWFHSDLYLTKRAHLAYKHNGSPEHSGWATKV